MTDKSDFLKRYPSFYKSDPAKEDGGDKSSKKSKPFHNIGKSIKELLSGKHGSHDNSSHDKASTDTSEFDDHTTNYNRNLTFGESRNEAFSIPLTPLEYPINDIQMANTSHYHHSNDHLSNHHKNMTRYPSDRSAALKQRQAREVQLVQQLKVVHDDMNLQELIDNHKLLIEYVFMMREENSILRTNLERILGEIHEDIDSLKEDTEDNLVRIQRNHRSIQKLKLIMKAEVLNRVKNTVLPRVTAVWKKVQKYVDDNKDTKRTISTRDSLRYED